jgi:lipoprotein signal peptidase
MLAHHDRHQPGRLRRPHATRYGSGNRTGNAPGEIQFCVNGENMSVWIAAFLLIPIADQAIKALLRQQLGDRVVSLGPLGSVRVIDAPIWWARGGLRPTPAMLWIAWLAGAGALVALVARLPGSEWCAALLLGGSLSHMIETSRRGRVCDYLCLRFWPAFNLADAAISIGTVGFIVSALVNLLR